MSNKESEEFGLCFSAYLQSTFMASNTDAADAANTATDMVKHLIKTFPKIRDEIMLYEDGEELLSALGISTT